MSHTFRIATLSPGLLQPGIALATSRAGELAILDFEYARDPVAVSQAIQRFNDLVRAPFGVKLDGDIPESLVRIVASAPPQLKTVVLTSARPEELKQHIGLLKDKQITTLLEANNVEQATSGASIGVDGVIAKGHEAGGRVADETTFILLQRLLAEIRLPVWAHGGVGLHTAAACAAAGAAGIVLDAQLALARESSLPETVRARIATMDGSETICLGEHLGEAYRVYFRPGNPVIRELQELESRLAEEGTPSKELQAQWRQALTRRAGWESGEQVLFLGQDAAFAAPLAQRFRTVGGILQGIRNAIDSHCQAAVHLRSLAEGSPLACSNGTRYPILQGPMTRVSDVPEFAARVAEGGALPFLALALMRGPEVKSLLQETQRRLGALPWGVGILGFVPQVLRQEQIDAITEYHPPFALIAGGRPDQARVLEQQGIATYLHVPSSGLLRMFVQQGARRFIFEGRECGGHVGPRTSFVLWNQMVDVLLDAPQLAAHPEEFHVVFAAGIHDALSAAMVSVIAAPLAERGVKVGVLLGTAYLFTEEAVASGAILDTFQEQARQCRKTVLLETGPGHSTRCVETPYAGVFAKEKRRLSAGGVPAEEIRLALEELNLGRLRVASKGVARHARFGQDPAAPKLVEVSKSEQVTQGMFMIGQVAALRHATCTVQELHQDIAIRGCTLLEGLAGRSWQHPSVPPVESPSDVAIIGMACLLPKAPSLQAYWENILHKVDAVGEIPKDRWDWELYFDSDPKAKDKIYSKWGGFLDEVPFDPVQYGMPPASLRSIEPAQLLTLEVVRAALDDAGYSDRPFPRERTSVILGAGGGAADLGLSYGARSFIPNLENLSEFRGRSQEIVERLDGRLPEWTEDSFAGILTNVLAGRVANRFDLGGSNYTVDAACASSLAAVSLALKELESRSSDMVIVGGVDTMQNPFTYLCFSKTHALSPRGRCRTFDESADGIAISEGIVIMVFKRLADAERDGDRIYAVIKGAGTSSDGKDRGLTAPRPEGQARALKRAYAKAGISPGTVGLVEAHGTGTVAGDGAEVQALTEVFSEARALRQGCAIGSVKSMIGHAKCAAGAAGLAKAALALYHSVLPPTLGVEKPNPRARLPESPFFVNTEPRPWLKSPDGHPCRAGVSAFGFGGTNFHIVLEQYTGDPSSQRAPYREWSEELFLWTADSRQNLVSAVETWDAALADGAKPLLRDLAYTAWKQAEGKDDQNKDPQLRLAIVASSVDDLRQKLGWARQKLTQPETLRIHDPRGIYFSHQPLAPQGKLAFLFPGQGSQYPRMLQDLLLHFPKMREAVERATRVLAENLDQPLSAYIFPPPAFNRQEEEAQQHALRQTNIAQPALGAVSLAMFGLLQEFGLRPEMVAGHSYGEYVALAAAGAFSLETLIALSEARGRFIVETAGAEPGVMAAIEADAGVVAEAVKNCDEVCLANANAPRQSVVSGTRAGVQRVVEQLAARGATARMIPVACAFHSPLVAAAQEPLAHFLSAVQVAQPEIAVYSNTTAGPYLNHPQSIKEQLVEHLVQPVNFAREIEAMYDAGARVFVEVGPRGVLTSLVDEILADRPKLAVSSNQSGRPGLTHFLHLLGQLAAQGYSLNLDLLFKDRSNRRLALESLREEYREKPLSPSVWMINGAHARPLKDVPVPKRDVRQPAAAVLAAPAQTAPAEPLVRATASAFSSPVTSSAAPSNGVPLTNGAAMSVSSSPFNFAPAGVPAAPVPLSAAALDGGAPQMMAQFQQIMTRFLEMQKSVMLAYLGGASGAVLPAAPPASPVPEGLGYGNGNGHVNGARADEPPENLEAPVARPPVHSATVPVAAPARPQAPPPAGPDKKKLTGDLLAIVSDRTGYPPEMLDLHLDLEADLGIDSIKRVEILGTLQQSFAAAGMRVDDSLMEKLSSVRTLQGILDRIFEQVSAQPAGEPALPGVAAEHSGQRPHSEIPVSLDKGRLTAQLLLIVSERTGYPVEMLDLKLDLEADLGIDSIKRVEILGTLQQSFAAAGLSVDDGLMEMLSGVRTLEAIIDRVSERVGFRDAGNLPAPSRGSLEPAPSPAAATPTKAELTTQLLSIVSERTGYPPEMLNLNLDLEADLGIDSIKRVEILGTFQQSFAAAGVNVEGEGLVEKLSGLRTLQSILDQVFGSITGAAEAGQAASAFEVKPVELVPAGPAARPAEPEEIGRFMLRAREAPLGSRSRSLPKDRVIIIVGAGHLAARELAAELIGRGHRVAVVDHGRGVEEREAGSYIADLTSPESVAELIALVSRRHGPPAAIVHLLSLQGEPCLVSHDVASWREQLRVGVKSLFYVAKAAGSHLREAAAEGGACLIAATGMGGSFLSDLPHGAAGAFADHGAIPGLMKSLALEWPEVHVKAVDLNLEESGQVLARHLLDELHAGDDLVEVGHNGRRRVTLQVVDAPLRSEKLANLTLDASSVVLITGGGRGICARTARWLAERYRPTLVLAGRSPVPEPHEPEATAGITATRELKAALMDQMRACGERVTPAAVERAYVRLIRDREVRSTIAALRQLGSRVHYHSVDVRDAGAFGAFLDGIYESFGRLDGVIHGAGIIEDKLIQDKTPDSFDRVFDTKVDSAFVLARKLRPERLQFLLFFASVAGRFGNRGQGDYAAANEVLNKLAVCLDRTFPGRVAAINWGPWDTEGMVSAEVRKQFSARGVKLISPETGLRRLEEEIEYGRRGETEIVIGGAGWQSPQQKDAVEGPWPLLGRAITSRGDGRVEVVRELDPAYDLYLNDHRLDGQPVLPFAVATELMVETVAQNWTGMQVTAVRDARVLHGIVLENGARMVRLTAKPQGGAGSNPASVDVEITGTGKPHRVHYRATVELGARLAEPPSIAVAPMADGRAFSMDVPELYRRWLFHGPLFHGIGSVDLIGVSGVKAYLQTSQPGCWLAESQGQWLIDPLTFDSALQLILLWAREHWDMTALPTGFQSYRRFAPSTTPRVLCEVRFRPNTGRQTIHADIFFLDPETGRPVGILEDMHGACSKGLNRLTGPKMLAAAGNPS